MARQMRSKLAHNTEVGSYAIDFPPTAPAPIA
jgi:hypothetical protein